MISIDRLSLSLPAEYKPHAQWLVQQLKQQLSQDIPALLADGSSASINSRTQGVSAWVVDQLNVPVINVPTIAVPSGLSSQALLQTVSQQFSHALAQQFSEQRQTDLSANQPSSAIQASEKTGIKNRKMMQYSAFDQSSGGPLC